MELTPRIAFFGTPELCIPILESLKEANMLPAVVVTQIDAPKGRGMIMTAPPVKVWAEENNIPVVQPEKLNEDFFQLYGTYDLDLAIVVAYGKIIPERVINLPRYGSLNVHYSLLPKYRGATPVEAALLAGDAETGVCIQQMHFALDSGPVLAETHVMIEDSERKPELLARLNEIAAQMLPQIVEQVLTDTATRREQDPMEVTYSGKIEKAHGELRLTDDEHLENWRKFRAFYGNPGTFTFVEKDGKMVRLKITDAEFVDEKFVVKKVIPEGKKETDFENFLKS